MMAEKNGDGGFKIEKLNGKNYVSWKYNMKLILMEKGLYRFITRDEVEPGENDNDNIKRQFRARKDRKYSLIALAVETSLQIHIVNTTDPQIAWETLKNQFSFISVTQIVRLTRKFYAATMTERDDLMKHVTNMTTLS